MKKCDSFKNFFPFNDGFIIATFNPFKGYIKRRELEIIKKESKGDMLKVYKQVKKEIWNFIDNDLRSQEDIDLYYDDKDDSTEDKQPYLISDMMYSGNPVIQSNFIEEFKKYIKQFRGNSIELSLPNLKGFPGDTLTHVMNDIDHISYFGLMHDAVMARWFYDLNNRDENGDNPIIGDLSGDPFQYYSNFNYFLEFMSIMNFTEDF